MTVTGRRNIVSIVWTVVGVFLFWRGLPYAGLLEVPDVVGLTGSNTWIALVVAVVVGIGKGMSALRKGARRAVTHIVRQGDRGPWWNVFSPTMYVLVAIMVAAGIGLRTAPYDAAVKAWVIGILYPAVGVALVIGGQLVRRVDPLPASEPTPSA
ncbi:MAG: hypothetical protein ACYTGZ_13680 [Planctomycetota bacterium]|jgi:hypothetical protein